MLYLQQLELGFILRCGKKMGTDLVQLQLAKLYHLGYGFSMYDLSKFDQDLLCQFNTCFNFQRQWKNQRLWKVQAQVRSTLRPILRSVHAWSRACASGARESGPPFILVDRFVFSFVRSLHLFV